MDYPDDIVQAINPPISLLLPLPENLSNLPISLLLFWLNPPMEFFLGLYCMLAKGVFLGLSTACLPMEFFGSLKLLANGVFWEDIIYIERPINTKAKRKKNK